MNSSESSTDISITSGFDETLNDSLIEETSESSQSSVVLRQITGQFPNIVITGEDKSYSMNDLDDYSLLLIFSKLTLIEKINAQKVCQTWKNLINKLILCQTSLGVNMICAVCDDIKHQVSSYECIGDVFQSVVDVNTLWYFVNANTLHLVLSKCPNLKSLMLQNCIFCREVLEVFSSNCSSKLEHLDLSFSSCNISEILQIISEKCKQTLKHVMLKDNEINESSLRCLINSCKNMEVLILDKNDDITGESFALFGDKINYLSIVDCKSIDDLGFTSLLSGNGRHLTHLKLGNTIKPSAFRNICENLNQLRCLEFDGFRAESANSYNCISLLTSLEELILTLPRIPFDLQLIDILRKCHGLKKLKIDGPIVNNVSLKQFSTYTPLIEHISIIPSVQHMNDGITDESRFEMGSLCNLRSLSLCGSSITDQFVGMICCCPRLAFIELDACKRITSKSLKLCIEMAKSRPNDKIMLFIQRTSIEKPSVPIPSNLSVFGPWII